MDRLAELAQYDQAIPGLVDDDFLAAGFTPEEIASYRGTFTPPSLTPQDIAAAEATYGTLQAPDYTMRETSTQRVQDALINQMGLDPYLAGRYARDIMGDTSPTSQNILDGLGLADLTPLGAVFGVEEGGRTAVEGYQEGDPLKMGLGVAEAGLGIAEAFPLTRPVAEGASVLAREIYDSPYMADVIGNTRALGGLDFDFLRGRGDPSMAQGVGADVVGGPTRTTAAEMRRQANIQRFGYDPSEVSEATRAPTDDEGFEAYLEQVNPGGKRVAAEDRPNLAMGDMYGMLPRNSDVVGSQGDVTFHRSPDGEFYATAFNPDVGEEDVVGYITDRGDSTELAVVQELQGQGIGGELQYLFRAENPDAPTGGLTEAGEASLRKTYGRLVDEGIVDADAVGRASSMNISESIQKKYPDVSVDLFGDAEKGYELSRIVVPEGERGSGVGTQVMDDMIEMADEQGARISLTPDTTFGGTSVSRLKDFYKRFGFVENKGKNKDFSTRNTMYRDPQMQSQIEPRQVVVPTEERPGIIAFHGSGADFDRFELSKIGTGERAQAFGRGLYFTDSEDIAEFYRQSVRQRQDMSLGREVSYRGNKVSDLGDTPEAEFQSLENSAVNRIAENINRVTTMATKELPQSELAQLAKDKSVSDLQKQLDGLGQIEDDPIMEMVAESLQGEIDALQAVDVNEFQMAAGKKYQVNIDVSPEELLNWDLPLDQQTPAAQRAILKTVDEIDLDDAMDLGFDVFLEPYDGDEAAAINAAKDMLLDDFSARKFLQSFSKIRGKGAGEDLLAKNGLKGITYKADQGPTARDPSSGGPSNYVIFDDKLISIMKKYGIVGPVAVSAMASQQEQETQI